MFSRQTLLALLAFATLCTVPALACRPTAPGKLYYKSTNGRATVFWDGGSNPCADEYHVTFTDAATGSVHSTVITPDLSCVVKGIVAAKKYNVRVKAYNYECDCGAESVMPLTGEDKCDPIPPSKVVGLYAQADVDKVKICFEGPANYGCVNQYLVYMAPSGTAYDDTRGWVQQVSHGRCVTFDNLAPATEYMAAVQAYSSMYKGGSMAWVYAKTKDHEDEQAEWTCKGTDSYPKCAAASMGLCQPMTCEMQAKYGKCGEDWMRKIDWEKKVVTQYCVTHCPCPTFQEIPLMKAPTSWIPKLTGSATSVPKVHDDADSCCKTNSYSYSPINDNICLSPFGAVIQVQMHNSENGSSVSSTVSAQAKSGGPRPLQCGGGPCPADASSSDDASAAGTAFGV